MDLKDVQWSEFNLNEIFSEIQRGKRLKKDDHIAGNKPYISSSSANNGVDGFIGNTENVRSFKKCLTIANSGSVGATFYQPFDFVASDHITKLENKEFTKYVYLFISSISKRIGEKYSFNREINDKRIQLEKIILPTNSTGGPDYDFMERYMRHIEKEKISKFQQYISKRIEQVKDFVEVENLKIKKWGEFFIEDIFNIKSGKRLTKADMNIGELPFIGASDANNGITNFVSNTNSSLDFNVLGVNYNGSVVENFYHPYKAIFSDDVKRLSLKEVEGNEFLYLFIKTMILKQKSKFMYAYKFNETRMLRQKLLFPINKNGKVDYDYMENFIKKLEYEKVTKYLERKTTKM
nr:restriction endonuclease subunit S [uncultured Flavobacterium sp.]